MGEKILSHFFNNVHFIKEKLLGVSTLVAIRILVRKTKVVFEKVQLEFRGGCSKVTTAATHLIHVYLMPKRI